MKLDAGRFAHSGCWAVNGLKSPELYVEYEGKERMNCIETLPIDHQPWFEIDLC